jgi:hypothetical protein
MTAITVIGLVAAVFIKVYPLGLAMDEDWGLEREVGGKKASLEGEAEKEKKAEVV